MRRCKEINKQKGPVAQSVVHRTYRKEKCEGRGFDPRQDHFFNCSHFGEDDEREMMNKKRILFQLNDCETFWCEISVSTVSYSCSSNQYIFHSFIIE